MTVQFTGRFTKIFLDNPADGTLLISKFADASLPGSKLSDGTINSLKLANGAVTLAKLDTTGASAGPIIFSFSGGGTSSTPSSELMRIAASCFSLRTRTFAIAVKGG